MRYNPKFDSSRDLLETIPDLSIDLKDAIENGVIKDVGVIPESNMIDNPFDIGPRVGDVFQAIDYQRELESAAVAASAATAVPAAPTAPAAPAVDSNDLLSGASS